MKRRGNKFGAVKKMYNGILYDSTAEAHYARKLDILQRAKDPKDRVLEWERQVPFPIVINGIKVCTLKLDFVVPYADGRIEYPDVKGYKKGCAYQHWRTKKKLVEAVYGIQIIEVK